MSSKNWIMVKRGLSEDPEHRERMGNRVWLFLHIIDRCNWDTGIVHDWRDEDEARDMGMNHRTLTQQRQELSSMGYITCVQRSHGQDIVIHNWVNPRNYSGGVLNKKGTVISVPSKSKGTVQGTVKGSRNLRTPTLGSGIQVSGKDSAFTTRSIQDRYIQLLGYSPGDWSAGESKAAKAIAEDWTPDQLEYAYRHFKAQSFWSDKRLPLVYLKKQMPELFKNGNGNGRKRAEPDEQTRQDFEEWQRNHANPA